MLKNSRQRNSIKQLLQSRTDHPTAAEIYDDVRRENPRISLGTVYRNLNLLAEMGEIRRVDCGGAADRFDGNMMPHYHHVCIWCGAVHDIDMPAFPDLNQEAQKHTEYRILSHDLNFYGVCRECEEKKKTETVSQND